jgi:hypothetical protein
MSMTNGTGLTMMPECQCRTKCCKLTENYPCHTKLFIGISASMVLVCLCDHGGCLCPWWMSTTMLHVMSMLHVHVNVHSAMPCSCPDRMSISMSMRLVHVCVCGWGCVFVCVHVCMRVWVCVRVLMFVCSCAHAHVKKPDCTASSQSGTRMKKLVMPGLGR